MRNDNNDQKLQSAYAESIEQALTVVAVALVAAVVVIGIIEFVAASGILAAIVSFFAMVGTWLGQLPSYSSLPNLYPN